MARRNSTDSPDDDKGYFAYEGLNRVLQRPFQRFLYTARYPLGALLPKGRRPQTVIVVARKRRS